jgi:hypothetical protein
LIDNKFSKLFLKFGTEDSIPASANPQPLKPFSVALPLPLEIENLEKNQKTH